MADTNTYYQDRDLQNQFVEFTEFYKKVGGIQFSLLKNQEIVDISTIPIKEHSLYNQKDHTIFESGPLDLRLGVGDKKHTCNTCKKQIEECPGHYGYIKLVLPIYHIGYFKHTLNMLQGICKHCSRVLLAPTERDLFLMRMKRRGLDRLIKHAIFKKILTECKKVKFCPHCGGYNGTVKKMPGKACKILHVYVKKGQEDDTEFPEEVREALKGNPTLEEALLKRKQEEINPLMAFQLLSKMRDEDAYLFNIDPKRTKPVDFMVTHILVPPVCIRPMVQIAPGLTNEDDLTMKIQEILKCNNSIARAIKDGVELPKIFEAWYQMESHYAHYINSTTPGLSQELIGKKANIRALCQRLKGKNGRFRGNLSGKRVNFSGRTVISPDPNISIDQVIVPQHMAKVLTYPERVTKINFARMKKLVQNGPENYPGANYLEFADGSGKMNLMFNRKLRAENLKIGDIVERHLSDGDIVLFNRQPSLHRLSIMAHRAKVLPWRTLRFNECVCTPYNADFDGDEMNIHLPQTEEARTEALYLMGVHQNLLTPKNGEPIIALTQDFLTTSYLLTLRDRFFDRAAFSQICSYLGNANEHIDLPPPTILKPVELWTGKQVINMILCPNKKNRILVNVNIKEKDYSGKGEFACIKDGWVLFHNSELMTGTLGKSVLGSGTKGGLFYSIIKDNSNEQAAKCMNKFAKLSARWLTNHGMTFGITDVTPSPTLITSNQEAMRKAFLLADEKIASYKDGTLPLMAGCTAEQTLENVLNGILSQVRDEVGNVCRKKLPPHNSPLIMAICGSKGSNINLSQMIGCVGQQTLGGQRIPYGFTNRTLPHFEKGSKQPASRGFVKNSFYTGLTGPEFLFHTMGGREGLIDTAVKTADTGYMQRRLMKALEDLSVSYDYSVRTSDGYVVQFMYGEDAMDPMMMEDQNKPLNFERLWNFVKGMFPYRRGVERTLYPYEIKEILDTKGTSSDRINMKIVSDRFKEDLYVYMNKIISDLVDLRTRYGLSKAESPEDIGSSGMAIEEIGGQHLAIGQEIVDNILNVTKRQLEAFFDRVWERYTKAMITPGEAVGAVTAQSIGEPGTQMTLKTFHFAGVASMNVTMGVPRIKEIINAANKISTPIITAKLINEVDPISARIVKGRIEKTILGDVCQYIKEVYSPEGCFLSFKLDVDAINALKLDINATLVKECILKTPRTKIKKDDITVVNPAKFNVKPHDTSSNSLFFLLQHLKKTLPQTIIKGIPSINRAVISKKDFSDGTSKYNLAVEGYGLRAVMNTPGIDGRHTTTNHIMETEKVLGIEAARKSIAMEISQLMKNHSMTVDERHFGLLADIMTYKGVVLGITRFGVAKMKDSTLTLASFEKTTDILFDSAIIARNENVLGVSDCIILGDAMKIGTGTFKIMYDSKKEIVGKSKGRSLERILGDVKLSTILEE